MGIFRRKEKPEIRADTANTGTVSFDDALLSALLGGGAVNKQMALAVPTVSGGIDLIANIVASTPIKLYREEKGKAKEVTDDSRTRILNDETGDTLNANEFWRAIVRDYYTGKGGYAYINRDKGEIKSLHYVDEERIAIIKNADPIFKDFDINVNGATYKPYDFLKVLRNTKDGAEGTPITVENAKLIEVAYESLLFERNLVKRGGNKKGFLKSENRIDEPAMIALRTAFANLYSNTSDNMVVLNKGIDFKESSDTSTEMQLNENKLSNAAEFAKIFHISTDVIGGKATEQDTASLAKLAAIPLMTAIQCALNKDFLLEKEKGVFYWAFDTKELLKGDMKERFEAYKTALDANFMGVDEVRFAEDLEPLGLTWIKLGLNDVLYDPANKTIYTPNTNKLVNMGEPNEMTQNTTANDREQRANPNHDAKGRFTSGGGGASATFGREAFNSIKNTEEVKGIVGAREFGYYGIRVQENDTETVGGVMTHHSKNFGGDFDDDTSLGGIAGDLDGVSTVGIESTNEVTNFGGYKGKVAYLVGSNEYPGDGYDPGERIMKEPTVLAKVKIENGKVKVVESVKYEKKKAETAKAEPTKTRKVNPEYTNFMSKMAQKYGADKMWSDMDDKEFDEAQRWESNRFIA